jgi:hypothetical protein
MEKSSEFKIYLSLGFSECKQKPCYKKLNVIIKTGCHLDKYAPKCACTYTLARALAVLKYKLRLFPNVQLVHIYKCIFARIYVSDSPA